MIGVEHPGDVVLLIARVHRLPHQRRGLTLSTPLCNPSPNNRKAETSRC